MARSPSAASAALMLAAFALALGACGGSASHHSPPEVFAAASLTGVLPKIDPAARYTFAGSDALAAQIEHGAPADVFIAASPRQPAELLSRGLIDRPVEFATNALVLVVPRSNPGQIRSVSDITRLGVKLVICAATVPCGDYARKVFRALGITATAMRNVVSQATDVTQTLADVALGDADAGFVYISDARSARGRVSVIQLPPQATPHAEDLIAVVRSGADQAAARAFVNEVLSPRGQAILRAAGFGPP